jgi:hypothetical protein
MKDINGEMISQRATKILEESRKIVNDSNSKDEPLGALVILAYRRIAELQLELEFLTNDPEMHTMLRSNVNRTDNKYECEYPELFRSHINERREFFKGKRITITLNFKLVDGEFLFNAEVCRIDSGGWRNTEFTKSFTSPYNAIYEGMMLAEGIIRHDKYK